MKQITVKDEYGNKYDLAFTARSIEVMEKRGFRIDEIESKPFTTVKTLFTGAFIANHKNVTQETVNSIYDSLADKEGLLTKLVEMYNEPLEGLMIEGNSQWEANW